MKNSCEKSPADAFSRYGLAMECVSSGDAAAAIRSSMCWYSNTPTMCPAYLMYAQLLARESRADEAKEILTKGIAAAAQKGDHHAAGEMETLLADLG